ncbi:Sec39 domain-containing protein [Sphaerosporella brunnea]|uniref:Sec39 domain-containing protein n=1 Tax=Sphaerosporella brunnea TaxID=1250544 RepID=A0A5J5EY41_9PEZI|nr:Sec39 domain-containing protein [Sphaerosporella brunnea]
MAPPAPPPLLPAQIKLLAASLASSCDLPRFKTLLKQHPHVFTHEIVLRLLLWCLPETTPPAEYGKLVFEGAEEGTEEEEVNVDATAVRRISDEKAQKELARILPPLPKGEDAATTFLVARAELIDSETGALSIAAELLRPFVERIPKIRELHDSHVEVLAKLVYAFSREAAAPGLKEFRRMSVREAVEVLVEDPETVVRDLNELVEPYMLSEGRGTQWGVVWERLQGLPFARLVLVVSEWTPPETVREEFAAWVLRMCYNTRDTTEKTWDGMHTLHRRIEVLMGGKMEPWTLPESLGDLRDVLNPLFRPTRPALALLDTGVTASALLGKPLAETVRLRLEGSAETQSTVLRQYVRAGTGWDRRDDEAWRKVRDGARWLRNKAQVLEKISVPEVEKTVLAGMLAGLRFGLVRDVYVTGNSTCGLPVEEVEKCVLAAFNDFVDNATNGNKTRGRMKYALQALQTLYPHTSTSPALSRANSLISAIHALSNFHLPSSNRNSPLLPVQIRIHSDPLSLLTTLLANNPRSYQRADSLLQIARDLVFGTTTEILQEETEARVLGMCAEAALVEDDFETAYAYITSRLLPPAQKGDEHSRSTLWRTALQAGRFRSSYALLSGSAAPTKGPVALAALEKKRELLAWALAYCPPEAAADVLGGWRRNEEEIEVLMEAEQRAEEEHAKLGSGAVSAKRRDSEAPRNLFDVARGAARVFSTTAVTAAAGSGEEERVRKRDVVSGMVTRGLAGGIGWVLGAQPNINHR